MATKRKRDSTPSGNNAPGKLKRVKAAAASPSQDPKSQPDEQLSPAQNSRKSDSEPSESLWGVKDIIDENSEQYLIDWEDYDGQSFEPTWEPKSNANELAIRYWEEKKKRRVSRKSGQGVNPKRGRGGPSKASLAASKSEQEDEHFEQGSEIEQEQSASKPKRGRGRPRKFNPVENTPVTEPPSKEPGQSGKRGPGRPRKPLLVETPQSSAINKGRGRPRKHPIVEPETSEHEAEEPENDIDDQSEHDAGEDRSNHDLDGNYSVHDAENLESALDVEETESVDVQSAAEDQERGQGTTMGEKKRKRSIREVSSELDTLEISSQPIRRKPGRPRIHLVGQRSPETEQLTKRGPGRPRKDGTVTPRISAGRVSKRGPGRPPKNAAPVRVENGSNSRLSSASAPEEDDADNEHEEGNGVDEDGEEGESAAVARRGPGRPRKNAAVVAASAAPRGRGRPRKYPVVESRPTTDPPKRRGRPSKSDGPSRLQVTLAHEVEETSDSELITADNDFASAQLRREETLAIEPSPTRTHRTHDDNDHDMISDFQSSQVLKGTQPEPASGPQLVDAAAAGSLSQKHSEYEPGNTSLSSLTNRETGQPTSMNSSSGVHTFQITRRFGSGVIIPDSQSFLDSSILTVGGEATHNRTHVPGDTSTGSNPEIDQDSADDQPVPESSVVQKPSEPSIDNARDVSTQHELSTQSIFQIIEEDQILHNASSPARPGAEEGTPRSRSPASPGVARSSSSTSSPPPTESPDKSQSQTQSQPQSQSQSQANSSNSRSTNQPAQRRDFIYVQSSASTDQPVATANLDEQSAPLPEPVQYSSESSTSRFITQISLSVLQRRGAVESPDRSPPGGSLSSVRACSSLPFVPTQDPPDYW